MTKLSHSAANRYLECGKSYEYHYVKRYRGTEQSAALLFGTAIDKATEHYALAVKANKVTREVAKIQAHNLFEAAWSEQELNGTRTELQSCTEIVYGNNDLDLELFSESDYKLVNETHSLKDFDSTIKNILERKDKVGFKKLTESDKKILNQVNWICLFNKGQLMMKAFCNWFDENVIEVLATQKRTELVADADSVTGFIDLVALVKGFDKPVILDVKTSARPYEEDAVVKSVQLSGYVFAVKHEYEETNYAGYIVLQKNIKKNKSKICSVCKHDGSGGTHRTCANEVDGFDGKGKPKMVRCGGEWNIEMNPECVVQYMVDVVPELLQERVIENYEPIAKGIEAEIFPRNFQSCIKWGVVKCAFYDLCHGNSMEGLVIKEETK